MIPNYFNRFSVSVFEAMDEYDYGVRGFETNKRSRLRSLVMQQEAKALTKTQHEDKQVELIKKKIRMDIEGHILYQYKYVLRHMLNNLSYSTAIRYVYTGQMPSPIYTKKYSGRTLKYYSAYQIKCINRCWGKNPKNPVEERIKKLHEKFKQDPLLEIYNERRNDN